MAFSEVDNQAALIVVDLQRGLVSMVKKIPVMKHMLEKTVLNSATLAERFRELNLPVVLVHVKAQAPGRTDKSKKDVNRIITNEGDEGSKPVKELGEHASDLRLEKHGWSAFDGTDLHQQLQELGVTQVFLTGCATSIGVESTARSAYGLGYHVAIVSDAVADVNPVSHMNSVKSIFPRLGEVGTTAALLTLLKRR